MYHIRAMEIGEELWVNSDPSLTNCLSDGAFLVDHSETERTNTFQELRPGPGLSWDAVFTHPSPPGQPQHHPGVVRRPDPSPACFPDLRLYIRSPSMDGANGL